MVWSRLIKVYGGLRWDDRQRLRPANLELQASGLVGWLTRAKTSGVGRRVRELPLFVLKEAFISSPDWAPVGFYIWKEISPINRDYFIPRPIADAEEFSKKIASPRDPSTMGVCLLACLRIPEKDSGGGFWSLSVESLLPGALQEDGRATPRGQL
jgi:hypothetical protein